MYKWSTKGNSMSAVQRPEVPNPNPIEIEFLPDYDSTAMPHAAPAMDCPPVGDDLDVGQVLPSEADRRNEMEASISTVSLPEPQPEPKRPSLFRLTFWCLGLFLVLSFFQLIGGVLGGAVGFAITGENPFAGRDRYREIWRFESMPADDGAARQWFQEQA